jgi:hypothetical protein
MICLPGRRPSATVAPRYRRANFHLPSRYDLTSTMTVVVCSHEATRHRAGMLARRCECLPQRRRGKRHPICNVMYRPAGPTQKISKRAHAEIREIHRTRPVMLLFLLGERVMRMSSSLVAPLAVAILSTSFLCGLSGTAASQTTPSSTLPSVTVTAPEQRARPPQRQERTANTGAALRRGPATRTAAPTTGGAPQEMRGPVMAKLARLEREASSCNDGCESSFRRGKDPWVGCSESAGYNSVFSATCKDTLTHRDYAQCVETKMFLGWDRQRSWWYCTGMLNGGKFRVTAENRNR